MTSSNETRYQKKRKIPKNDDGKDGDDNDGVDDDGPQKNFFFLLLLFDGFPKFERIVFVMLCCTLTFALQACLQFSD